MRARDRRRIPASRTAALIGVSLARRRILRWLCVPAAYGVVAHARAAAALRIASARLWPAQEYTRLILESSAPIELRRPGARPEAQPRTLPPPRRITIAIDPGHGGEDPGAIGRRGTYEKNVTLAIARRLKAVLDAEPNMRAMLTRDDDYFVPL